MINTTGIAARICLSQVIRILTSCLEKKTGNKSPGDKIWLGEWRCTRMTQPCWGSPKSCFSWFSWVSKQLPGEPPTLCLCSCHPTAGKSHSQGSSRWGELISCQEQSLGSLGWAPAAWALLMDLQHGLTHTWSSLRDLDPAGAGAHPDTPEGQLRWDGTFGMHSRNSPASLAFLAGAGAGVGSGVGSPGL